MSDSLRKNTSWMEKSLDIPERIRKYTDETVARLAAMDVPHFINGELAGPAGYLLRNNGKLLRPVLVFLGAEYIGGEKMESYIGIAEAIELLHTSSLVHDDIIDGDSTRRGMPSTHAKFGVEAAILAGNALISGAIQSASPYGREVVDAISKSAMRMCAGEMLDFRYQQRKEKPSIGEYMEAVGLKSSSLIGTSTCIAAIYNHDGRSRELYDFGFLLGTAFQIRDDIIDFYTEGEAPRRRLNIVNCIMENEKLDEEEALRKAAGMNVEQIEMAVKKLGSGSESGPFREYAEKVAVRGKEIERFTTEKL